MVPDRVGRNEGLSLWRVRALGIGGERRKGGYALSQNNQVISQSHPARYFNPMLEN